MSSEDLRFHASSQAPGFIGPAVQFPELQLQAILAEHVQDLSLQLQELAARSDPAQAYLRPPQTEYTWLSNEELGIETDPAHLHPMSPQARKTLRNRLVKPVDRLKIREHAWDEHYRLFFRDHEKEQYFNAPKKLRSQLYLLRTVMLGAFNEPWVATWTLRPCSRRCGSSTRII